MDKQSLKPIIIILMLGLALSAFWLKFGPEFPVKGDSIHYDIIAQNLANGKGFSNELGPTAEVGPGYPLFLSLIYNLFGRNFNAVQLIQCLLLIGMSLIIFFISQELSLSKNLSLLAGLLVLFWPYLILYSTLILTEILFIFFLGLTVFYLIRFIKQENYSNGLMGAALLGISMLIRPLILLLPIWLAVFLIGFKKLKKQPLPLKQIMAFLMMAYLVISPWILRNYLVFNELIPVSSGLGPSIVRAYVAYDYTPDSAALQPGKANIGKMISSRLKNIFLFWNPGAGGERAQELINQRPSVNILLWVYRIAFLFIILAGFLSWRFIQQKPVFLVWSIIFYFWALHTILYPYPRYTLPIMPLVIVLAILSASRFVKNLRSSEPASAK